MKIIPGSGNLSKLLNTLKAKIGDITPLNHEISDILITSVHENFLVGGRFERVGSFNGGNSSWKDLSDVTKKARQKIKKWPGQLLRVTGRLFNSIVTKVTGDSAQVGTNLEYARAHQYGAKKGSSGTKSVNVKAHTRKVQNYFVFNSKLSSSGQVVKGKAGKLLGGTAIKGAKGKTKITVKAHTRKMSIPWGDIPARPFLVVQEEDLSQIGDMIMNRLMALDNKP